MVIVNRGNLSEEKSGSRNSNSVIFLYHRRFEINMHLIEKLRSANAQFLDLKEKAK
jgi:hypothetical protein